MRRKLDWILLLLGAMVTMLALTVVWESTYRVLMHTAECYRAVAVVAPVVFAGFAEISERRWASTTVAAVYTVYAMAMLWIFPFFPATPKLGPVYQKITHMVPMEFPLLIIVPALRWTCSGRKSQTGRSGRKAAALGLFSCGVFLAVQWPFANFLVSPRPPTGFSAPNISPISPRPTDMTCTTCSFPLAQRRFRILADHGRSRSRRS